MINLKLLKPHHHADKQYQAGDGISVPQADADWLISQGIAELVEESPNQQSKKKQTA